MNKNMLIEKILKEMHENVSVAICTECGGGGSNGVIGVGFETCKKCNGTGIEQWFDEYFTKQLEKLLEEYELSIK